MELAATGRLARCLQLESGQFTAEGNMQERPRQMILISRKGLLYHCGVGFCLLFSQAVQSHNEVIG